MEKELQGLGFAPDIAPIDPGNVVLRGVPRAMADRVNQILLEVTPQNRIARIQIDEADGSTTEYRFSQPKEDLDIADKLFRFSPPPGVETIEGELGSSQFGNGQQYRLKTDENRWLTGPTGSKRDEIQGTFEHSRTVTLEFGKGPLGAIYRC